MIYTSPHSGIINAIGSVQDDIDSRARGSDRYLLVAVVILMVAGALAVYSSIVFFAESKSTTAQRLMMGHLVKLVIAFTVMLITSKINYHILAKFSRLGMVVSWILLLVVILFGTEQFGAKRWLNVGGFSFQPSTIATVSLILHVCVLLHEKQSYIKDFKKAFTPILFWVLITCALIGIEDFSTSALLLLTCLLLMFVGRISMLQLGVFVAIGLLGGALLISQSGNRQLRIQEYLSQVKDIPSEEILRGNGYQAQQAYIAIARGETFGVGLGKSAQRDFLPASYNDFIFAIIAEEHGLVGALGLLSLFTLILIRGIVFIARKAEDTLGKLVATGYTVVIVLYGFVNAGVASGILPVTGLPMPFISYGGTSILLSGFMVGILLNISKHKRDGRAIFYG